jgi:hypothetical protein
VLLQGTLDVLDATMPFAVPFLLFLNFIRLGSSNIVHGRLGLLRLQCSAAGRLAMPS